MARYVSLSSLPDAKTEYAISFESLNGGLNLWELDYRLDANESPEMQNLMWRDGTLNCRDGQVWLENTGGRGAGLTIYNQLFHGHGFAHIGTKLYYFDPAVENVTLVQLWAGLPEIRGTFFQYDGALYYKTRGAYLKIVYSSLEPPGFDVSEVVGYTPIIVINASPENGSGDTYQPENRLSASKTVWYNAVENVQDYYLPVQSIDAVTEVVVDGSVLEPDIDYSVDLLGGVVNFTTAPPVTDPPTNNTVHITYSKANTDAYNSIMDCPYAETYGGTGALCVVMGGCAAQPNAYFWNGNNIAMDAGYFPISQYQLAGDTEDAITGFGKQQSYLIIFKEHSVGRSTIGTETINDRLYIDMPYVSINSRTGCDLPWTIQLIENNLVWCNTEQGVHVLKDSSSALENNIECLSRKINGSARVPGLLADVRSSSGAVTCSCDDDHRYWVVTNSHAWVWDYELSSYQKPAWFYFTNIHGVAFAKDQDELYHLDAEGRITKFQRIFADYDGPIEKRYRFATQYFSGYDRLKNVNSVIIVMRSDTNALVRLIYLSDYEQREDLTPLSSYTWLLVPRDLTFRSLAGRGFASVFRRRPACRRIRHFTMLLENNIAGQDLSIVSAQIFFNYQGRQR